ncbi:hypothetical protein SMICM17S_10059 [Streptomyces microflavus]
MSRVYSAVATFRALAARSGFPAQQPERAQCAARRGRGEAGVEDERTGRVDQVVDDPGRSEDRTALAAQRLGEGERGDGPRAARQSGGGEGPASAVAEDAEAVGVVDEEGGVRGAADLGQRGQRCRVPVDREDRVGDGERPSFVGLERLGDRVRIGVRDDRGLRARPAAVHDGRVVTGVGDGERAAPGERGQGREIGRVAGGEDEGRLEAAEVGEFPFEFGVQRGGSGDQP